MQIIRNDSECLIIEFDKTKTNNEVHDAIELFSQKRESGWSNKVICSFYEKVDVRKRTRKKLDINTDKIEVIFFKSEQNEWCYRFTKRTGFALWGMTPSRIKRMELYSNESKRSEEINQKQKANFERRLKKALYDSQTWTQVKADDFYDYRFRYIDKIFSFQEMQQIEDAFKNKEKITIRNNTLKKTYTVETKMGEDGIFRAWFSSEDIGYANGDYYLLLNPKLAVFQETD